MIQRCVCPMPHQKIQEFIQNNRRVLNLKNQVIWKTNLVQRQNTVCDEERENAYNQCGNGEEMQIGISLEKQ